MKQVFILRGLPGSGKSYYAQTLADELVTGDQSQYLICSTDDYFYDEQGEYKFDKFKLSQFHNLNLARFINALSQSIPLVIVDNTNIKKWEFIAYSQAALALGYQVKEVIVGEVKDKSMQHLYAKRNSHKVPLKMISKMAYMFEW
ncbi:MULTISPECIES: AAA family ATPase [unclassified Pseudoalteromonas]|uniref:AAA family ATPase n=1 Tax=unclassified Pseudoalteromonas TaxID=194690 RepID=UPI000C074F34|nr:MULTISPECIES: AAA family ATPase [unclassified Pseudoalteromonas]MDP2634616.1 AAA family ATPase [Pseudoalteromonas sp. 1_MG-2023]PHN91155.1 AAA family ATPase [Pseudoalteromonas sp. 3D05]